jgi:hypothetical protein
MRRAATHTPLQALLHNVPLAESVAADFKKGTWTFKASSLQPTAAGSYVILPAIVARLALEQEAASAGMVVQLQPPEEPRSRFFEVGDGQIVLSIQDGNGYEHTLYRDYQPTDRTAKYWHPAHWRGHENRVDASGKAWRSMATYITDDFGELVEVSV